MNRRGFLVAILATATAPAIVRASSLMPIVPRVWTRPDYYGGFGLAQLREEGAPVLYDCFASMPWEPWAAGDSLLVPAWRRL